VNRADPRHRPRPPGVILALRPAITRPGKAAGCTAIGPTPGPTYPASRPGRPAPPTRNPELVSLGLMPVAHGLPSGLDAAPGRRLEPGGRDSDGRAPGAGWVQPSRSASPTGRPMPYGASL
jgi:hypothetical protein